MAKNTQLSSTKNTLFSDDPEPIKIVQDEDNDTFLPKIFRIEKRQAGAAPGTEGSGEGPTSPAPVEVRTTTITPTILNTAPLTDDEDIDGGSGEGSGTHGGPGKVLKYL